MKKYLKKVTSINFDFLSENSPAEVRGVSVYSDIESHQLYLSPVFLNVSDKVISGLSALLILYDSESANLPYEKISLIIDLSAHNDEFYVSDETFEKGNAFAAPGCFFGGDYMVPLPESYFKRLKISLLSVAFADNSKIDISDGEMTAARSFSELDSMSKITYDRLNIYKKTEERFPAVCIPLKNDHVWICCCGEKNPLSGKKCLKCSRDRDWLFEHIAEGRLEEKARELADMKRPENAYFAREKRQQKIYSFKQGEERMKRIRESETVLQKVERQQRKADKMRRRALNILLVWLAVCAIIMLFKLL